jgi:hypothetical protein
MKRKTDLDTLNELLGVPKYQDLLREHHRADEILTCDGCRGTGKVDQFVFLELNIWTHAYTDPDVKPLPEKDSQGCFPFCKQCAKKKLKKKAA